MVLKPLWNHIFHEYYIQTKYRPKDYALVCIDVFSRYVWAVAMDKEVTKTTANAIVQVFHHMGTPIYFQGDKKIIDAFEKYLEPLYPNVRPFVTKPHETNKNAIVERVVYFQKGPILEWAVFYTKPDILSPLWVFRCPNIKILILMIKIVKMRSTLHILFICSLES